MCSLVLHELLACLHGVGNQLEQKNKSSVQIFPKHPSNCGTGLPSQIYGVMSEASGLMEHKQEQIESKTTFSEGSGYTKTSSMICVQEHKGPPRL